MSDLWENFSPWRYSYTPYSSPSEAKANGYKYQDDAYANSYHTVVSVYHEQSGQAVYFKAYITAFNESYACDWVSETVLGRTDPLYMFRSTTKTVTLALKIPAATIGEAYENLAKVQSLTQFMYPIYKEHNASDGSVNSRMLVQSSLLRLKVMNLLSYQHQSSDSGKSANQLFNNYGEDIYAEGGSGQLGVITSFTVNHNLENADAGGGVLEKSPNTVLPKLIEVNLDFSPIHEGTMGWAKAGESIEFIAEMNNFPYGATLKETADVQSANADDGRAGYTDTATNLTAEQLAAEELSFNQMEGVESSTETQQNLTEEINSTSNAAQDNAADAVKIQQKQVEDAFSDMGRHIGEHLPDGGHVVVVGGDP